MELQILPWGDIQTFLLPHLLHFTDQSSGNPRSLALFKACSCSYGDSSFCWGMARSRPTSANMASGLELLISSVLFTCAATSEAVNPRCEAMAIASGFGNAKTRKA